MSKQEKPSNDEPLKAAFQKAKYVLPKKIVTGTYPLGELTGILSNGSAFKEINRPLYVSAKKDKSGRWNIFSRIRESYMPFYTKTQKKSGLGTQEMLKQMLIYEIAFLYQASNVRHFSDVVDRIAGQSKPENHIFNVLKADKEFGAMFLYDLGTGAISELDVFRTTEDNIQAGLKKLYGYTEFPAEIRNVRSTVAAIKKILFPPATQPKKEQQPKKVAPGKKKLRL